MPTALITGAGGFCALHLARRLRQVSSLRLIGFARGTRRLSTVFDESRELDLRDRLALARAIAAVSPSWVFHLAGSMTGPAGDVYESNVIGTLNLLEAIREHAPHARVLLAGSAAEYGPKVRLPVTEDACCEPRGPYGISKYAATLAGLDYGRRYAMNIVVARPFNIVGAGMPASLVLGAVLNRIKQAAKEKNQTVVPVGNIDTERDFVAVEDIADAYVRLIEAAPRGEIFNLCSGQPRLVRDVIQEMLSHSDTPIRLHIDAALARPDDLRSFYGTAEKARHAFGFSPSVPLEESLKRAWMHEMRGEQDMTRDA